jgi:hypothetical protein
MVDRMGYRGWYPFCTLMIVAAAIMSMLVPAVLIGQSEYESLLEQEDELADPHDVLERLEELRHEPLDANRARAEELQEIPWIYPALARSIVMYRKEHGAYGDLDDLRAVPGMTDPILEVISSYLTTRPRKRLPSALEVQYRVRGERTWPTTGNGTLGSPYKAYQRIEGSFGDRFLFGGIAEKDPYEKSPFDHVGGYLQLHPCGQIWTVITGHYWLDFAEGLVYGSSWPKIRGSGVLKGAERGIQPYRSTNENAALLGAAAEMSWGSARLFSFASRNRIDAAVNDSGLVENLSLSGLHTTEGQMDRKDALTETMVGTRVVNQWSPDLRMGATWTRGWYDPHFAEDTTTGPRDWSGYQLLAGDFSLAIGEIGVFGEAAMSMEAGKGGVVGFRGAYDRVNFQMLMRRYDANFWSPHSNGFADGSDDNEEGGYAEMQYRLWPGSEIGLYADVFKDVRWTDQEEGGHEWQARFEQKLGRSVDLTLRHRSREKRGGTRTTDRLNLTWSPERQWTLVARIELARAAPDEHEETETGNLTLIGVTYRPQKETRIEARLSLFDTDSWDSRIYQYEGSLSGVVGNVPVYGNGTRFYVLVTHRLPMAYLGLKYGQTRKEEADTRRDVAVQLELRG